MSTSTMILCLSVSRALSEQDKERKGKESAYRAAVVGADGVDLRDLVRVGHGYTYRTSVS